METDVDPTNYSTYQTAPANCSTYQTTEGVDLNPHQVFIKTEPQLLDPAFTEQTTQYGQTYIGQDRGDDQTKAPFSQNIDAPITRTSAVLDSTNQFGLRNDLDIQSQYHSAYFPPYFPEQSSDSVKVHIGSSRVFPCDVCHKVFNQKYNLMRHKALHTKERKFSCDVCAKTFVDKYQLKQHTLMHSAEKPYACNICNKAFIQKYMLRNHMMTHTDDKPFACACGLRFRQIGALNRHRSGKFTKKTFQCDLCMKIFKQKAHLIRHIMFHNGDKQYSCNICNKRFSQQSNLNTHKLIHSFEKRFTCELCDKSFRQSHHLSRHKKMHLKENNAVIKVSIEVEREMDIEYNKSQMNIDNSNTVFIKSEPQDIPFAHEDVAKQESTLETGDQTLSLDDTSPKKTQGCPFAQTEIELPKEYLEKKEKKYYPCEVCRKVFYKPFHLARHKVIHSGVRPFTCDVCNKSFFLKYHLQNHMTTHNGLKPFVCNICNTCFNRKSALGRHMQLHLDKSRFSCTFCNRTFSTKPLLIKHQNRLCKKKSEFKREKMKAIAIATSSKSFNPDTQEPHELLKIEMEESSDTKLRSPGYDKIITQPDNLKTHDRTYLDQRKSISQRIYIINEQINFYICDHCDQHFKDKSLLIHHLQENKCSKTGLIKCQHCSGMFSETSLPIHKCTDTREQFSCEFCHKNFSSRNSLKGHKQVHRNEKKPLHECKVCKKQFRKGDLTRHELIHTREKPFKCDICIKAFTLKSNLIAHQIVHTVPKRYACRICRKSFNSCHHMIMHKRGHGIPEPPHTLAGHSSHKAPETPTVYSANTGISTEQVSQEPSDKIESIVIKVEPLDLPLTYEDNNENSQESTELIVPEQMPTNLNYNTAESNQSNIEVDEKYRFFCNRCQRGFRYKISLIQHLAAKRNCGVIRTKEREACKICSKVVAKYYLKSHERSHTIKPYSCEVCSKSFSRKNHLVDHSLLHSQERPHICDICQRSFTQKAHWLRHQLVHSGEKRYHCDICNKSFARRTYWIEHNRMHSGEKPFTCNVCPKSFFRSSSLSQHRQIHKQHKPFICNICYRGFPQKIHLQTHILRHDEANRFACEVCQKSFSKNSNLGRHMKIHARINPLNLIKTKLENQDYETNFTSESETKHQNKDENNQASQSNSNLDSMSGTVVVVKVEPADVLYEEDYIKQEPLDQTDSHENPEYGSEKAKYERQIFENENKVSHTMRAVQDVDLPEGMKGEIVDEIDHRYDVNSGMGETTASDTLSGYCKKSDYNKTLEQYRQLLLNMDQALISQKQIDEDDADKFECDRCKRQFKYKASLFMHIQANKCIAKTKPLKNSNPRESSATDKHFQCDECDKYFARNKSLKRHKATHKGIRAYTCNICNNSFTQKSSLIRHAVVHSGEKTFSCNICNKSFGRNSTLNKHKLIHSNERRYPCEHCDKSFVQKIHLQKHQVVHTGEKRYPCDYCDLAFSQKSALMRHKTCHIGEKRYMCAVCDKLFTRKTHLVEHEKTHTGEKPFSCDICFMKFTFKSGFRRHKRLVHSLPEQDNDNDENDSISWNEDLIPKTEEVRQSNYDETIPEHDTFLTEEVAPSNIRDNVDESINDSNSVNEDLITLRDLM